MKILIIGASGFLGSTIARTFMADSHQVSGTYIRGKDRIPEGCTAVAYGDIGSLDKDFDVVVIAAGSHALPPQELVEANYDVAHEVMRTFPETKITYVSSIAVYGDHDDVMNETSVFDNPTLYGWAKLAGEAIVRTHPKFAIVRPTYLYGKNMPPRSFVPAIIGKAKAEKQITLFGNGERLQDYLHVEDAAELCLLASKYAENGTFLGATGHSVSNADVGKAICEQVAGCQLQFAGEDTAAWFQFDPSETKKALGWEPQHELLKDIQELI